MSPGSGAARQSSEHETDKRIFSITELSLCRGLDSIFSVKPRSKKFVFRRIDTLTTHLSFLVTGAFALTYQAENQNPSFGQGLSGYGKRYTAALGDKMIGNM